MIPDSLLQIMVCPEDKTPVKSADVETLARINQAISAGELRNQRGETLEAPLDGALIRADGTRGYPIQDDIPVMLIDASFEVPNAESNPE
jgi:uncharacterized protein YbaR (Trm112 family)